MKTRIANRSYGREYEELETYTVGISLTGAEVKSIRAGAMKLEGSYVRVIGGELWLVGAHIYPYAYARNDEYDPQRSRRLLITKRELTRIRTKMQGSGGLTMAPKSCFAKGALIKLEVGLVKGRKDLAKRKLEKARDISRNEKRAAKDYMKG